MNNVWIPMHHYCFTKQHLSNIRLSTKGKIKLFLNEIKSQRVVTTVMVKPQFVSYLFRHMCLVFKAYSWFLFLLLKSFFCVFLFWPKKLGHSPLI